MARISGVDIPPHKHTRIALRYIYGVGPKIADAICAELNISPTAKSSTLTDEEVAQINNLLDRKYAVEGGLRRQINQNIARLKNVRCYRGLRHIRGLPVRGQQTQSNARTRKGKKKTVAGKKSVKSMK
ncbi:MAG TPA: 30S ribosomal protein S13 [Planctomycetota bacterium]|jgi:small subunit ribosomal protein S13|nr:30S ribosomal protein S13 [Planctomycetota bacterium]